MHTTLNVMNSPKKSPILKYKSNIKVISPSHYTSEKKIQTSPINNNKILKPSLGSVKSINFVFWNMIIHKYSNI